MKIRSGLKTALMTTVGATTIAGLTAIAAAQTVQNPSGGGAMSPQGIQQEHKGEPAGSPTGGTSTLHPQNGAQPGARSPGMSGPSAQQGPKAGQRTDRNAAQSEKSTTEMGAQRGTNEMNPQQEGDEKSPAQKGAQSERNERGKAGINTAPQNAQGGIHGGAASRGASVQLSQDQRSRIGTIIGKSSSARVTSRVDFDVSIGARVPRRVLALPIDVVQIVPQYEGYDYVVVGDQILIIDPDSMEIVAVIPV